MANRNYNHVCVDQQWWISRETHPAVAAAIHAISDYRRGPQAIWESPTGTEFEHVLMAVEEYVAIGLYQPEEDGRYAWGLDAVVIEPPGAATADFEATACNCVHWIKLRVSARSLRVAIAKFQAYLDQANPDWSREEFNAVNSAAEDDFEVADYEYKFDESDVRQLGVVEGPAPSEVEMVGSGANGC